MGYIDADLIEYHEEYDGQGFTRVAYADDIESLPTVELIDKKRLKGEWIDKEYGIGKCYATCSECGEISRGNAKDNGFGYDYSFSKYCPYCGADMRGDKDGCD